MTTTLSNPAFEITFAQDQATIVLTGEWTLDHGRRLEIIMGELLVGLGEVRKASLDLKRLDRLDTLGALVIDQISHRLGSDGVKVEMPDASDRHLALIGAVRHRNEPVVSPRRSRLVELLADVGQTVVHAGQDLVRGISFIGEVVVAIGRVMLRPASPASRALPPPRSGRGRPFARSPAHAPPFHRGRSAPRPSPAQSG